MDAWVRFDQRTPAQGDFIAAITHRDQPLPAEEWEADLECCAVGVWVDGEVWVGNTPCGGFTHWTPLPERPVPQGPSAQLPLWGLDWPQSDKP